MSTPFTFSGSLQFPPDAGLSQESIPVNFSSTYTQLATSKQDLVSSGSKAVDFGGIASPGAKLVLVKVDASSTAAPVMLRWNSGSSSGQQEVAPGGFCVIGSGSPVAGLTALTIVYTTNVTVRIWVLG